MALNSKGLLSVACGLVFAGSALATTRSSFLDVDSTNDITFVPTNVGLTVDVILGTNPTFTIGANTYHVTSVIGFYYLSNDDDLTAVNPSFSVWGNDNSNSGPGGIAGWKSNPNNGFDVNQNQAFTFSSINMTSVECVGLHVITSELFPSTNGNTGNIAIVPEPASIAALGLGVLALIRRRKQSR